MQRELRIILKILLLLIMEERKSTGDFSSMANILKKGFEYTLKDELIEAIETLF